MIRTTKNRFSLDDWTKIGSLVFTLCSILVTIIFGMAQLRLAKESDYREAISEPIHYSMIPEQSNFLYEISINGETQKYPAVTTKINIQRGSVKEITAITYDGETFGNIEQSNLWFDKNGIMVDMEPLKTPLYENGVLYDYFFLYIEAMSGENVLDLICTEIDLNNKSIKTTTQYHAINLIEYGSLEPGAKKTMLNAYRNLNNKIEELNL